MGDVSHAVPAIHPWLAIVPRGASMCHDHTFVAASASDAGIEAALLASKALARTAVELLGDAELLAEVTDEWRRRADGAR